VNAAQKSVTPITVGRDLGFEKKKNITYGMNYDVKVTFLSISFRKSYEMGKNV
jgi:hypothetical protein